MHHAVPLLHDYLIDVRAPRLPDKVALVCERAAAHLRASSTRARTRSRTRWSRAASTRGDRVVVFADNTVETVVAFWAVLKANAVVSIVNPLTKADKLAYLLERLPRDAC